MQCHAARLTSKSVMFGHQDSIQYNACFFENQVDRSSMCRVCFGVDSKPTDGKLSSLKINEPPLSWEGGFSIGDTHIPITIIHNDSVLKEGSYKWYY